jgi:predicted membrane-bound spermidine synthase
MAQTKIGACWLDHLAIFHFPLLFCLSPGQVALALNPNSNRLANTLVDVVLADRFSFRRRRARSMDLAVMELPPVPRPRCVGRPQSAS